MTIAHVVVDQPFTVLPGYMDLLPRNNIQKLACELKEAGKSPILVPVLEGSDCQPVYTLSDIVRAEHNYGVRQSGRKSVGPALSKMPTDRLSVNPDIRDANKHILKTIFSGGVLSEAVRVLPASSAAEAEGTATWTDHIGTLTPDQVEFLRKKSVCLNAHGCQRIQALTRSQADSTLWKKMRKIRMTASNFGLVVRRIKSRYPELLESLLSDKVLNTLSTRWGKENESKAVDEYEKLTCLRTEKCGLYLHQSSLLLVGGIFRQDCV